MSNFEVWCLCAWQKNSISRAGFRAGRYKKFRASETSPKHENDISKIGKEVGFLARFSLPDDSDRIERNLAENAASLVVCTLRTGRTHQIRVHLASIGHPVVADPMYSKRSAIASRMPPIYRVPIHNFPRQALHAYKLGFSHPTTGKQMIFESVLPGDMKQLLEDLSRKNQIIK